MIVKANINNFKCFKDITIKFGALTILVGGNGVGKSTIVQSILLFKHSLDAFMSNGLNKEIIEVPLNGPYLLQLGKVTDILSSQASSQEVYFDFLDEKGKNITIMYDFYETFGNHLLRGHILKDTISEKKVSMLGYLGYLNAERLGPRRGLPLPPNSNLEVGYQGGYTGYSLYQADLNRIEIQNDLKLIESARFSHQVESWLSVIIPNQELKYQMIEDMNLVSLKYRNSLLETDFLLSANTGFGISYVLPIIVEGLILSSIPNSTLIVENPEAHLNPLGQSRIGRFLARLAQAGVQVIIETHSEHVANGARIEFALKKNTEKLITNFFSQSPKGLKVEELCINNYGEFSKWPEGFFDQEKHDLKELFMIKRGLRF